MISGLIKKTVTASLFDKRYGLILNLNANFYVNGNKFYYSANALLIIMTMRRVFILFYHYGLLASLFLTVYIYICLFVYLFFQRVALGCICVPC